MRLKASLRTLRLIGVALGGIVILEACSAGSTNPLICTADFVYAISVGVRDSVTGVAAARGAQLVAEEFAGSTVWVDTGDVVDSLHVNAGGLAGTYDLAITKPGYAPWTRNGVVVVSHDGGCHPATVLLDAYLQPSS